jgi:hypothetical protein
MPRLVPLTATMPRLVSLAVLACAAVGGRAQTATAWLESTLAGTSFSSLGAGYNWTVAFGVDATQVSLSTASFKRLGSYAGWLSVPDAAGCPATGVRLAQYFAQGSYCSSSGTLRSATVEFRCSPNATTWVDGGAVVESPTCVYSVRACRCALNAGGGGAVVRTTAGLTLLGDGTPLPPLPTPHDCHLAPASLLPAPQIPMYVSCAGSGYTSGSFCAPATPSSTRSSTGTQSATHSRSGTRTASQTKSNSPTRSRTPSITPTASGTSSNDPTRSRTPSRTPTGSRTPSNSPTPSGTPSNSPTSSVSPSHTVSGAPLWPASGRAALPLCAPPLCACPSTLP